MNLSYDRNHLIAMLEARRKELSDAWDNKAAARKAERLDLIDVAIKDLHELRKAVNAGKAYKGPTIHRYLDTSRSRSGPIDIPEPTPQEISAVNYHLTRLKAAKDQTVRLRDDDVIFKVLGSRP